jgi:hypothetical protein
LEYFSFPLPVFLNRFAAALFVFIFGISASSSNCAVQPVDFLRRLIPMPVGGAQGFFPFANGTI